MSDERLRVPVHPDYAAAVGLAVYCFASLEWNAVWCCERIERGSIEGLEDRTAGRVADTLVHLVKRLDTSHDQLELHRAATNFRDLVATRNNLVHAKPASNSDGSQVLFRHGDPWTVDELEKTAVAFTRCSLKLNEALHGFLCEIGQRN
jgi:hypothetical protein